MAVQKLSFSIQFSSVTMTSGIGGLVYARETRIKIQKMVEE
jgi:hypothetical protein